MNTPGKFEGNPNQDIAAKLYDLTMDGGQDEEFGDVQEYGRWYGLILNFEGKHYIVDEDDQGFFTYTDYETEKQARRVWAQLEAEYAEETADAEEETEEV